MKQQRFPFRLLSLPSLPPAAINITLVTYLVLCVGLAFSMLLSPPVGLIGALVINLIVLFFMRSRLALPFYLLTAGPSVALTLSSSGILSRLYIGNLLFVLVLGVWILHSILPNRKPGYSFLAPSVLAPLIALILVGLTSIIYSRLYPDPNVSYSFVHSNVSLTVVNLAEMTLLVGLPMYLIVVPGLVRTERDVRWIIGAYTFVGILYALGTIFAAPLGLYSKEVILGYRRPEVFGEVSSGLGSILVLFTCIAFGQALYARTRVTRLTWGLLAAIFGLGVIMSFGREAWIGLTLAVSTILCLRLKNWSILLLILALLLLLLSIVLFVPGVTDFFNPQKVYGVDRLKVWQDAIAIWLRSPYIGVGAGNYQFFDLTYGTDVVGIAHNEYLQVLAEMGIPGLLCLLWTLIVIGRMIIKRFNSATTSLGKSVAISYIGYFVAVIFGGLFANSFLPSAAGGGGTAAFVSASYRWLLLGLVLCIPRWEKAVEEFKQRANQTEKEDGSQTQRETLPIS